MPETDNPSKDESEKIDTSWAVVDVSEDEYHQLADTYLNNVQAKFEELQDKRDDLDIEYAVSFLFPLFYFITSSAVVAAD